MYLELEQSNLANKQKAYVLGIEKLEKKKIEN
jgi:hypothetical protein